jgi:hypothetical protein
VAGKDNPMRQTAAEQRAKRFAEFKREREQEEQQHRDAVIAEFHGDPQAMATEILRTRHGLAQIADAVEWMREGAPFITMGPGPHWKPAGDDSAAFVARYTARIWPIGYTRTMKRRCVPHSAFMTTRVTLSRLAMPQPLRTRWSNKLPISAGYAASPMRPSITS